jgi:hypothetical protein
LAAALIAAAALSACGGGSHSSAVPPTTGGSAGTGLFGSRNAAPAPGAVSASLSITIPRPPQTGSSSTKRHAAYVSPSTLGIAVEAVQGEQQTGFQFYALGEGPNCVLNGQQTAYVCSGLSVSAPPGNTQILVGTYDSSAVGEGGPEGNLLSASEQTYTIQAGRTNNLTITLLPIAANVVAANPPPRCPIFNGGGVSLSTTYVAYDADGDDLSGMTLFNTISFTNDTNDGNYTLSPAAITSGSGTLSYSYTGTDPYPGIFTITTSIGTDGGSNEYVGIVSSIPVATPGPHYVYVADSSNNQIEAYDVCGNAAQTPNIFTLPAGTDPTEVKFDRNSSAADPRLFVVSSSTNNDVVWLDVASTPGYVVQTLTGLGGTPHEVADNGSGELFASIGSATMRSWTINEGLGTLSLLVSNNTFTSTPPRGFKLEGSGDDLLLGTSSGSILAVNPSTLAVDGSVTTGGTPTKLTGPNGPTPDCALAIDTTLGYTYAITVRATPETSPVHFNTIETAAPPVTATFFPPATPGSGNLGIGGSTAIIITNGGGEQLGTCNGTAETWTPTAFWTTFMNDPVAVVPSEFASTSVDTLIYVVGYDSGVPVLQPFASTYDHDLGSVQLPSGASPTSVTAGP